MVKSTSYQTPIPDLTRNLKDKRKRKRRSRDKDNRYPSNCPISTSTPQLLRPWVYRHNTTPTDINDIEKALPTASMGMGMMVYRTFLRP